MPIYEYRCSSCDHDLETLQKFSDPPLSDCPSCGKPELERLVSHSSFSLKGGGWYADGYGQKPEKSSGEGGKESSEKAGQTEGSQGKDTTSAETKGSGEKTSQGKDKANAKVSEG